MNISKKLDDMLESRWVLWIISVVAAASMWYFIIGGSDTANNTRKFLARVEYLNLQPQMSAKSRVSEVMVEVEAPERVMNSLTFDSIVCEVDLMGLSPGKYWLPARPKLPPNVIFRSSDPSELEIDLVRQVSRVLTVNVTLPQDIPPGQYLEDVDVVPREINVKASERDMAKIGSVSIAPTFAELQTGKDLLLPVNITQSQPFEDDVLLEPQQVRINATLVTGMPRKRVPVNVRLAGRPFRDYDVRSLTTDPSEVMIQGDKEKLDNIAAADTEIIDITNLSADQTVVVPLRAFSDEGVSAVNVSSVKLSIHLEPVAAQKIISSVPVAVDGASGQTKWSLDPPVVDVTVEALPSVMETLNPEALHIRAFVDVSGIYLRNVILPVWVAPVSGDFKVVKVEPATLTLSVAAE